jgi:SNF2 family DNA or RNA helicase
VCDEGHVLRNAKTATHQALRQLKATTARWILTGTPLHNRSSDLFGLLRFLGWMPYGQKEQWRNIFGSGDQQDARLQLLAAALMLRRTKEDRDAQGHKLVELPRKEVKVVNVTFSDAERAAYKQKVAEAAALLQTLVKATSKEGKVAASAAFLVSILRLRMFCDDPALCDKCSLQTLEVEAEQSEGDDRENDAGAEAAKDSADELTSALAQLSIAPATSSKFAAALSIIKDVLRTASDKVLVVSQWRSALDIVSVGEWCDFVFGNQTPPSP